MGYFEIADDFAQEYVMYCIKREKLGKPFFQPKYPFIDFMRVHWINMNYQTKGTRRRAHRFKHISLENMKVPIKGRVKTQDDTEALDKALLLCDSDIEKGILILRHRWGLNNVEIGEVFCLTESRISQISAALMKGIERHFKNDK